MLNFLGVESNFSVLAGMRWLSTFLFVDEVSGEACNLDSVTFSGLVYVESGRDAYGDAVVAEYAMELSRSEVDGSRHMVQVVIPALPEGRWRFSVFAVSDTGEKHRLIAGYVTAVGELVEEGGRFYANRTLEVRLPGDVNRRVQLEWQASTRAQQAAQQAIDAANGLRQVGEEAQEALGKAQEVLGRLDGVDELVSGAAAARDAADAAADDAQRARDEAQEIVDNAPREFVPTISADGYWVINGVVQPHKAIGSDGVDGGRVVKHLVDSVEDIPQGGETCNDGHVYYVPGADGQMQVFEWFDGRGWMNTTGSGAALSLPATATVDGTVKLGTDSRVSEGAPVGANAQGQLVVPVAEFSFPGVVMLGCASGSVAAGAPVGSDGAGRLAVPVASLMSYGAVKVSTALTVSDGGHIGLNSNGNILVRPASDRWYGAVITGPVFETQSPWPYSKPVSVQQADYVKLTVATVYGGALQSRSGDDWRGLMPWLDEQMVKHPAYFNHAHYDGLLTSAQFTQSKERGLELNAATEEMVGGVLLTNNPLDEQPAHVLDAAALHRSYVTRSDLEEILKNYILTNVTMFGIRVMTQEEYDAMEVIQAHTLYLVY